MALPESPTAVVGANVRAEMARRKVSQAELGAHLKLSQASVSKRLAGVTPFDVNELAAVAALLGVDLLALLQEIPESVPAA